MAGGFISNLHAMEARRRAIRGIESGSPEGRYDALGPVLPNGDQAVGAYQVMKSNVPGWTKEVFGESMSWGQFLADRKAQDAVFDYKFNQYYEQFGDEGKAAQAWFGGPGSVGKGDRKDVLGTSVARYEELYNKARGAAGAQAKNPLAEGAPPEQTAPPAAEAKPYATAAAAPASAEERPAIPTPQEMIEAFEKKTGKSAQEQLDEQKESRAFAQRRAQDMNEMDQQPMVKPIGGGFINRFGAV